MNGRDLNSLSMPASGAGSSSALSRPLPWSVQMADSVMQRSPVLADHWEYDWGVVLQGVEQVWLKTGNPSYLSYIQDNIDRFVAPDGTLRTYRLEEYNLDRINTGKLLFVLDGKTGAAKYRRALEVLRSQLKTHPRTREGGFWHKKIYPHQMWLDGIYMAAPFYAEFARTFHQPDAFDDVVHQIILIDKHTRDSKTGLLYHGWDESKQQRWANPITGCSPHFWGRAMGWYAMALVDVLDSLPPDHARRPAILAIFDQVVQALARVQDQATGLWYQVLDQGERVGNYHEASASCMFVYAIAKGVRKGYLPPRWLDVARKAYLGILGNLIEIDGRGLVNLNGICAVAGLGGHPYRDGSFDYYVGEKIVTNDYKGVGAFILASVEMETI